MGEFCAITEMIFGGNFVQYLDWYSPLQFSPKKCLPDYNIPLLTYGLCFLAFSVSAGLIFFHSYCYFPFHRPGLSAGWSRSWNLEVDFAGKRGCWLPLCRRSNAGAVRRRWWRMMRRERLYVWTSGGR